MHERTIGVLLLVLHLLAKVLRARRCVSATSLGVEGLTFVGAEPLGQRCPSIVNVVGSALRVCAAEYI